MLSVQTTLVAEQFARLQTFFGEWLKKIVHVKSANDDFRAGGVWFTWATLEKVTMVQGRTTEGNGGNTYMAFEVRLSIVDAETAQDKGVRDEYTTLLHLLGLEHN